MKHPRNGTSFLKRLVVFLILLSIGLFAYTKFQEKREKTEKPVSAEEAPPATTPSPSASPEATQAMTVEDLIRESKMRLRSERLSEPKLSSTQKPAGTPHEPPPAQADANQTSTPQPTPPPQPETQPAPAESASPTPAAAEAPAPQDAPIDLATLPKELWPAKVRLLKAVQFPLFLGGKQVGRLTAQPGATVQVTAVKAPRVEVQFRESKQWVDVADTDFLELAKAIQKTRAAAGTTPSQTSGTDAAKPAATSGTASPSPETPSPTPRSAAILLRVIPGEAKTQDTFPLIQDAVEKAAELVAQGKGVRILVTPGDYKETISWNGPQTASGGASLLIEAERPGTVYVYGMRKQEEPVFQFGGAAPVAMRGITVAESTGVAVKASDMTAPLMIERCFLRNNRSGLVVDGAPRVIVVQSAIVDNRECQVSQLKPGTEWDLRDSAFAALESKNLGTVFDGVPFAAGTPARVIQCAFFHPTLQNAFRMPDASLLGMKEWLGMVTNDGSEWSKERTETTIAKVFRSK